MNNKAKRIGQRAKRLRGFTMVELLAVIIVLVALGTMIGGIFFATLRGTNKSNALTVVRQSGDVVLLQMTKTIRNAKIFNGVSTDGTAYTTNCTVVVANPSPTPIPYKSVQVTSFDGGVVTYSCDTTPTVTISSNSASLLDTTAVDLVAGSCRMSCSQSSVADAPTIGISFTLKQKTTSTFPENQAQLLFQTSVSLRNATQ